MTEDINNDSLLELYLYESTSLLDTLDDILLSAEESGNLSNENVNEIFRIMHTIKGSSSMMDYTGIAEVSHKMEDLFTVIRNSGLKKDLFGELFNVVLAVSDFLKTEIVKIQEGLELENEVAPLTAVLVSLTEKMESGFRQEPRLDLGRILGGAPSPETREPVRDELAADISKVTARAAEAAPAGKETCYLHIHFNEGAKMENIRAFMLINKLNEKGTVNRTIPANPETDPNASNAIIERGFYISFSTTLFREQIETLIKGTLSVESVSFLRRMPDEAGSYESDAALPKPEPRPLPVSAGISAMQSPRSPAPWQAPLQQERPAPQPMHWSIPEPEKAPQHTHGRPVFVDITKRPAEPQAPVEPETFDAMPQPQDRPGPHLTVQPAEVPASAARPEQPTQQHANQNIISVELKKLDALLDLVGEIVINESIVTQNPDFDGHEMANFNKAAHQLDKLTNELQDTVMAIRMLPVSIVFQRMRRIVRDMGKSLGKEVSLILVGETTEVDKTILDALSDPIMHLIRNAMDHAIESPDERTAAGKSVNGHIILSAQNSGGDVIISISDDGRGLDKNIILPEARARGLLRKPESEYSDREIQSLIMTPGFSTSEKVSEFSGRGVGLDVVKSNIERIGGSVTIESKRGLGTNVIMKIPLTLAIISCMEISIGKEIYAIPINNIRESFRAEAGQIITDPTGCEMIILRGQAYPVIRLYDLFGCRDAVTNISEGILVLVETGDHHACILADSLVGKFQVVVKPLPSYLSRFHAGRFGISGCTIMGNGNISLIINTQELVS